MKYVISYRVGSCLSLGDALLLHFNVMHNPTFMKNEKEYLSDHTLTGNARRKLARPLITLQVEIKETFLRAGSYCPPRPLAFRKDVSAWIAGEYFTNQVDLDDEFTYTHNMAVRDGNYIDPQYRNGIFPSQKKFRKEFDSYDPTDKELEQIERNYRILEGILEDNETDKL